MLSSGYISYSCLIILIKLLGAGTGLSVRDYELSEAEDNVLLRTDLAKARGGNAPAI